VRPEQSPSYRSQNSNQIDDHDEEDSGANQNGSSKCFQDVLVVSKTIRQSRNRKTAQSWRNDVADEAFGAIESNTHRSNNLAVRGGQNGRFGDAQGVYLKAVVSPDTETEFDRTLMQTRLHTRLREIQN
jgi:hypothetical protein